MPKSKRLRGLTIYPTERVYVKLGQRIKFIREMLGITQVKLAKKIGITRTSLTNVEAGRQRVLLHSVLLYARALHTQPEHLLKGIWKTK